MAWLQVLGSHRRGRGFLRSSKPASVFTIDPLHDRRWPAILELHPRASVFHTTGWLRALSRTYGYEPVAFSTSAPDSDLQDALVFARIRTWVTGNRMVSLPFSDHCDPLFDSPHDLNMVLEHVQEETERERWKYLELRPAAVTLPQDDSQVRFRPAQVHCLHSLDLRPDLETIFRGFHGDSVRRRIRHAERAGVTERCGANKELLRHFYELMVLTRRRHHAPPAPFMWFQNIVDCLGSALTVRVAYIRRTPIAAILTLRFRDTLVYKYACSDKRFHHLGAMPFLLWRAIESAKNAGAKELDLGRSEEDNRGLIAFKNKWGARKIPLVYWKFPAPEAPVGEESSRMKLAKRLFAHMPASVLTAAGRLMYRHVG